MPWIKQISLLLLFALAAIYTQQFCHRQTDGFALSKITSNLTYHPEWEVPPLTTSKESEIREILKQKFKYLAKGAQAHVFASEDGKYVLKFFRYNHMRPPLSLKILEPYYSKKCAKLHKDFASYKLAYTMLKEKTGMVMLHLNKTEHLRQQVTIVDKIGISHTLDCDKMEFMLQKRAQLIYPQIDEWMAAKQENLAKEGLSHLVALLKERLTLGLFDKDPDLNTNFGFIGTRAIQIDVGRFKQAGPLDHDVIWRITDNLQQYLDARYPSLKAHLQEEIAKK